MRRKACPATLPSKVFELTIKPSRYSEGSNTLMGSFVGAALVGIRIEVINAVAFALGIGCAGIAGALAERGVSVFAVSSYDTDYILIKATKMDEAREALLGAGYKLA